MSYNDLVTADIRLVILLALVEAAGYSSNEYVLHRMIEVNGHKCSRDQLHTQLAWLHEQGLVTICAAPVIVATVTGRGADVAAGRVTVPGVQRPAPKD